MEEIILERINRAKYLLTHVRHIAMATVNEDGSPHNTPLAFFYDPDFNHIYWSSKSTSLHSRNIMRTKQAFFALYEGNVGGGLFVKATEAQELQGNDFAVAYDLLNSLRTRENKITIPSGHFSATSPQRLYGAKINNCYINFSRRDSDGLVFEDVRHEIDRRSLLIT